jgi:adenylosuccinate lyase
MIERYTREEMGRIWTERAKMEAWLEIEILACEARAELGEIPKRDAEIIRERAKFDAQRVKEIEETTRHDVIAFLTNVAGSVGPQSRHIHYGMTSSDILDTGLSCQLKQAGELLLDGLEKLKRSLRRRAFEFKDLVCVGRSHGIHAEPTTIGLKFVNWHEETRRNIERLERAVEDVSVGQISGAVGTFEYLSPKVEAYVCEKLGLAPASVSTQIIQRDHHAHFVATLALVGASLEKIATEIRHLQKTETLEMEEQFAKGQKGSSAMPHKRNPIICERISGMARLLRGNAIPAFENVALWHERDITHSSVERVIMPDSCIALDYILHKTIHVIDNLIVYPDNVKRNLELTRGLVFSQKALLKITEADVSREDAYRVVQKAAMDVWADDSKNLKDELRNSEEAMKYLSEDDLERLFDVRESLTHIDAIYERTVGAEE